MQVFCNSFAKVFKILTTGDKNKDYKIWDLQSSEIKYFLLNGLDSILLFFKSQSQILLSLFFRQMYNRFSYWTNFGVLLLNQIDKWSWLYKQHDLPAVLSQINLSNYIEVTLKTKKKN